MSCEDAFCDVGTLTSALDAVVGSSDAMHVAVQHNDREMIEVRPVDYVLTLCEMCLQRGYTLTKVLNREVEGLFDGLNDVYRVWPGTPPPRDSFHDPAHVDNGFRRWRASEVLEAFIADELAAIGPAFEDIFGISKNKQKDAVVPTPIIEAVVPLDRTHDDTRPTKLVQERTGSSLPDVGQDCIEALAHLPLPCTIRGPKPGTPILIYAMHNPVKHMVENTMKDVQGRLDLEPMVGNWFKAWEGRDDCVGLANDAHIIIVHKLAQIRPVSIPHLQLGCTYEFHKLIDFALNPTRHINAHRCEVIPVPDWTFSKEAWPSVYGAPRVKTKCAIIPCSDRIARWFGCRKDDFALTRISTGYLQLKRFGRPEDPKRYLVYIDETGYPEARAAP